MPMRDGTGPRGIGPRTGRGLGPCGNGERRDYGQGFQYGRGRGRRMGRCFHDYGYWDYPVTEESEKSFLENQIIILKERLKVLEEKLESFNEKDK